MALSAQHLDVFLSPHSLLFPYIQELRAVATRPCHAFLPDRCFMLSCISHTGVEIVTQDACDPCNCIDWHRTGPRACTDHTSLYPYTVLGPPKVQHGGPNRSRAFLSQCHLVSCTQYLTSPRPSRVKQRRRYRCHGTAAPRKPPL